MPSSLGPAEILVILVVALIVLGPARLPQAGRQVGKALAEVRRWTRDVQSDVRSAFDVEEKRPSYSNPIPTTPDWKSAAPTAPIEPGPEDPMSPEPAATPGPSGEPTPEPVVPVVDVPPADVDPDRPAPAPGAEAPPDSRA